MKTLKLTKTEKTALNAGTVWFDGELFSGNPNWQKLFNFRPKKLSKAEKDFLNGPVEKLCAMLHDYEINSLMFINFS